ncbi:uncharacterized protein LOC123313441 [Coccinella septempunctata]|uniref:uncharacterized protein LOC123313441 n=1 Tax=Coccinella septempunctata TaxID=41139 RepID=UPI001D08FC52|nr:uncharacterized protein LOC123313441 [Coccinella septempunctata]
MLSGLLNKSGYGYVLDKVRKLKVSHQLYMDDLKLFAATEDQMRRLLEIVSSFSRTIGMEMGLAKCAVLNVRRGGIIEGDEVKLWDGSRIAYLKPQEGYKYLGVQQALDFKTAEVKESLKTKYFARIRSLLKAKLNSKALFTSINIWALPCISYSFGVVRWTSTELQAVDVQTRKLLTRFGVHHPHSSVSRLYIPRQDGGRGLQNIQITHNKMVLEMRKYFRSKNLPFYETICQADESSALQLAKPTINLREQTLEQLSEEWHSKALHGRYPGNLRSDSILRSESLTYLKAGYLFPETEGRIVAIQDQVIPTRAYIKRITNRNIPTDVCRKCSKFLETVQHVTSSCPILAPRDYMERHNAMAKIFHRELAKRTALMHEEGNLYTYQPCSVLENENFKLYWDTTIVTDRAVPHNRPDIVLFDKAEKSVSIIDVTVPADENISRAYTEKLTKYQDLAFELKEIYRLKKTSILPLIISVNGLVESHITENTRRLQLSTYLISQAQKEVILATARMVRRFLTSH